MPNHEAANDESAGMLATLFARRLIEKGNR